MKRESWGSRIGFILAVAGSAIGLANIWRFPYIVGKNGGAAFVFVYLLCLLLIGFPVLMAEMLIGRTAQSSPSGAFEKIGGSHGWSWVGKITILTGFIVSAFYSAVAGWLLGYLIEAFRGSITHFHSNEQAIHHYETLLQSPFWGIGFHFIFILLSLGVLYLGVREGIERGNKLMMPLLFAILILLVVKGLTMPGSDKALTFLFAPDWSSLTPSAFLNALGQSFFTLSLGQGTMVTYGSYLSRHENLVKSCLPAVLMDTAVSILAAIAVFTIVFSTGIEPDSGPGLIFHTLPLVFSQIPWGHFIAVLFFLLVVLAALTSEISALEPSIAYLMDERGWKRKPAVFACGAGAFLLGIPCALSPNLLNSLTFHGSTFLDWMEFIASSILIPFGGFMAVLLVGWVWGFDQAFAHLKEGADRFFTTKPWLVRYFWFCFKFSAPFLIVLVFLHALGLFS